MGSEMCIRDSTQLEQSIDPLTESNLSGHLSSGDEEAEGDATDDTTTADAGNSVGDDYQLNEALNLLRGLSILGKTKSL